MRGGLAILLLLWVTGVRAQIITTIAGNHTQGFSGIGGPAVNAELGLLYGVAVDLTGNVYAADQSNNVIWKISAGGVISLYAGTGQQGYSGDGGQANQALLYQPEWLGLDPNGNLYFTDQQGIFIRKVTAGGVITTVAGNPAQHFSGGDGGPLAQASFNSIRGVVCHQSDIYISDNNSIRKVNAAGIISTIAGTGVSGYAGDGGPAIAAQLNEPYGVAIDDAGNIYIPDANNNVVRKINPAGIISTIAGVGQSAGFMGDGGPAVVAKFDFPWALTVDYHGNIFIADEGNWEIREIDNSGIITNYAGDHQVGYSGDGGPASAAGISYPPALACDDKGDLFLTDVFNYVVREIRPCMPAAGTENPGVSIATASTTVCSGFPVKFAATATDGGKDATFQWAINGVNAGPDSSVFVTDSLGDGDVVSCILTVVSSCKAPVRSGPIAMTVLPSPRVEVRPDTGIAFGQSLVLATVVGGPPPTYQWVPAAGLSSATVADPVAMPAVTTTYTLTVSAANGCAESDSVKISVYRRLALPGAFTPNGDGRNDVFRIPPGIDLQLGRFAVYNRAGERVFETGDIAQGWDGTLGGTRQPGGVYVWVIEYVDLLTEKRVRKTGTVVLVR